jgi:hypothetical protein
LKKKYKVEYTVVGMIEFRHEEYRAVTSRRALAIARRLLKEIPGQYVVIRCFGKFNWSANKRPKEQGSYGLATHRGKRRNFNSEIGWIEREVAKLNASRK